MLKIEVHVRKFMKKYCSFLASILIVMLFLMSSCTDSVEKLSSWKISRLYKKQLKELAVYQDFAIIKTGYYEIAEEQRCELKQLEAAGLISVRFDRFAWWEKEIVDHSVRKVYYDWWGYPYYETVKVKEPEYNFCEHIMANVVLTDKAKKQIIKKLPKPKNKEDKDVKQPKFHASKYPECKVDCQENWPEIKNPFIKEVKTEIDVTPQRDEVQSEKDVSHKEESVEVEHANIERVDASQYEAYQKALKKINETVYTLKGCDNKVVKAKNIQIRNVNGVSIATAIVIVEKKNVTDAYRVQTGRISGFKELHPVCLTYYQDKGWTLLDDLTPYMLELDKAGVDLDNQVKKEMECLVGKDSDSDEEYSSEEDV